MSYLNKDIQQTDNAAVYRFLPEWSLCVVFVRQRLEFNFEAIIMRTHDISGRKFSSEVDFPGEFVLGEEAGAVGVVVVAVGRLVVLFIADFIPENLWLWGML